MADTPPPVPPKTEDERHVGGADPYHRPQKGMTGALKAAISRPPSRSGDQFMFWAVRTVIEATKSLGFPVVIAFLLLWGTYQFGNKFIETQRVALATQQALLVQNNDAAIAAADRGTEAIKEMAAAQAEANEITRALMIEIQLNPPPVPRRRRPLPATQPPAATSPAPQAPSAPATPKPKARTP